MGLIKSIKNILDMAIYREDSGDYSLDGRLGHRIFTSSQFDTGLSVVDSEESNEPCYGAVTLSGKQDENGREIIGDIVVYPMYDDYKVFFKNFIMFFNASNPIISIITKSGETIIEGICELEFNRDYIVVTNVQKKIRAILNPDSTWSLSKTPVKDLNTIGDINKMLTQIKLIDMPHHPKWLFKIKDTFIDRMTKEMCGSSYFLIQKA